jgi:hypothetical protein
MHMTRRLGALSFCVAASVGLLWASAGDVKKPVATVVHRNAPPSGPFACTEVMGLLTTGEWFKAGFLDALGADLSPKWGGRFAHYGYVYEYANPDSYVWTPTPVGGVNNVQIVKCEAGSDAPDRIVYQAWSWQLTTEKDWIDNLTAAITTIRAKRPSAKRIDLLTIIRSPQNGWCHTTTPPLRPPLGPGTDHEATLQDSHVPDYVDAAFAKVAAAYPDLVSIAPKFEAHACAEHIDGIHLGGGNAAVAKDIAAYFRTVR